MKRQQMFAAFIESIVKEVWGHACVCVCVFERINFTGLQWQAERHIDAPTLVHAEKNTQGCEYVCIGWSICCIH